LGTGGGLLNCVDLCRNWTLAVNGDGLCMAGITQLLHLRHTARLGGALVGVPVEDTSRYGSLVIDGAGRLTAFNEKVEGSGFINSGFYLFRTELLHGLRRPGPSSIERDLIPEMIASGIEINVVKLQEAAFIDIGTPESLALAEDFIKTHFPASLIVSRSVV
jgi:D-glycero-alpha-D-manno-heptose 1-phosphate guanylyltransferase